MEDKKLKAKIIAALRKLSYQTGNRNLCLNAAKRRKKVGICKNGKDKFLNQYKCAHCSHDFVLADVQVDHRIPVICPKEGFRGWNIYMSRLFCDISNLQVLCRPCHVSKTNKENNNAT